MSFIKNIGDAITEGLGNSLFQSEINDHYQVMKEIYLIKDGDDPQAFIDKKGGVPGTNSLFNPFKIFRYSGFGKTEAAYGWEMHFDSQNVPDNPSSGIGGLLNSFSKKVLSEDAVDAVSSTAALFKSFTEAKKSMESPTASEIIRWAQRGEGIKVPYSPTDFLWCKYYGKIPNNRMVTLRRYPFPIEDDIRIHDEKKAAVPIAQAVTWYGSDIGNDLNKILNVNWGLKWATRTSIVQDIAGNEISVDKIIKSLGLDGKDNETLASILKAQVFSGHSTMDILKLSGYDTEIKQYIEDAYKDNGPYWNRILGPVNAIDRTLIRDRGFEDQNPVTIKFEYSLRSHGGINPKIAFLDLLSNFLSLTYNTAPFWGGGARYFETTGVTVGNLGIENAMLEGNTELGLTRGAETLAAMASTNLKALVNFAEEIARGKYGNINTDEGKANINAEKKRIEKGAQSNPILNQLAPRIGNLLQKPLIYRAILDGRAVGEWHVTVGNPMNPIAMMGNLCFEKAQMTIGETLGIDDFPTEFGFEVTLKHGRPRAKQDIESMFNLGKGAMGFSELAPPSSSSNSYGDKNTRLINSVYDGVDIKGASAIGTGNNSNKKSTIIPNEILDLSKKDIANFGTSAASSEVPFVTGGESLGTNPNTSLDATVARYKRNVGNMYGSFYENSPVLTDYFINLKTKD
jgi:hypothetical protein